MVNAQLETLIFYCGNDIVAVSELHDKLPLKKLEPQGGIELIAALHMGTKAKRDLCIMWSDDYAENQTKEVELCIT